jgi:hypothetical protein
MFKNLGQVLSGVYRLADWLADKLAGHRRTQPFRGCTACDIFGDNSKVPYIHRSWFSRVHTPPCINTTTAKAETDEVTSLDLREDLYKLDRSECKRGSNHFVIQVGPSCLQNFLVPRHYPTASPVMSFSKGKIDEERDISTTLSTDFLEDSCSSPAIISSSRIWYFVRMKGKEHWINIPHTPSGSWRCLKDSNNTCTS